MVGMDVEAEGMWSNGLWAWLRPPREVTIVYDDVNNVNKTGLLLCCFVAA